MKSTCKELRNRAWESLRGMYWPVFLMFLVFIIITGAGSSFSFGVLALLALPMGFACDVAVLNLVRQRQRPQVENLFSIYRTNFEKAFLVPFLVQLFISLWCLLLIVPGIIMAYAYSMAIYVSNDHPELSSMEAIRRSKELMRGHKWDLFVLDLSFIGWILLAMLTGGIGIFFLLPYIEAAHAEFYRELTDKAEVVEAVEA